MSLEHAELLIDSKSLWDILPDVIRVIGNSYKMNVEIAIPFFFAAHEAHQRGYEVMVSGQGPDELFAGYARYENMFLEGGPEMVEKALWDDVSVTDENNIQRDTKVIEFHGLHPFFPYLYSDFVTKALSIPATMNIDPKKKPARKLMFRRLAMMIGVPKEIAMEQKRATQYSSGSSKMLIDSLRDHVDSLKDQSKRRIQSHIEEILQGISHQQSKEG